jgi:hypothetical protein
VSWPWWYKGLFDGQELDGKVIGQFIEVCYVGVVLFVLLAIRFASPEPDTILTFPVSEYLYLVNVPLPEHPGIGYFQTVVVLFLADVLVGKIFDGFFVFFHHSQSSVQ